MNDVDTNHLHLVLENGMITSTGSTLVNDQNSRKIIYQGQIIHEIYIKLDSITIQFIHSCSTLLIKPSVSTFHQFFGMKLSIHQFFNYQFSYHTNIIIATPWIFNDDEMLSCLSFSLTNLFLKFDDTKLRRKKE